MEPAAVAGRGPPTCRRLQPRCNGPDASTSGPPAVTRQADAGSRDAAARGGPDHEGQPGAAACERRARASRPWLVAPRPEVPVLNHPFTL